MAFGEKENGKRERVTGIKIKKLVHTARMNTFLEQAKNIRGETVSFRRFLHQNAETGVELPCARAFIKDKLSALGLQPRDCDAGVIASIGKPSERGAFLLRADADALPIREKTGLPFACKNGNMHACGHDMHAAMLYGAAILLQKNANALKGEIRLLFQFGEETLEGAEKVLKSGVCKGVRGAMTLHVATATPLKTGTAMLGGEGVIAPCADFFRICIKGRACHGSTPHEGVDALHAAAHAVVALQSLAARETSLQSPAVLTLGKCTAGNAPNAIADEAVLEGTLRAYDEAVRERLKTRLQESVKAVAKAFRARAEVRFTSGCPTLRNNGELRLRAEAAAREVLGKDRVLSVAGQRGGGSEDFAYFSHALPTVMFGLAAGRESDGYAYPLHHPKTDFDEAALDYGAALYAASAFL